MSLNSGEGENQSILFKRVVWLQINAPKQKRSNVEILKLPIENLLVSYLSVIAFVPDTFATTY
jgi:hypothetical protein